MLDITDKDCVLVRANDSACSGGCVYLRVCE